MVKFSTHVPIRIFHVSDANYSQGIRFGERDFGVVQKLFNFSHVLHHLLCSGDILGFDVVDE